jgi:predicted AAA+ superfamily ATPase
VGGYPEVWLGNEPGLRLTDLVEAVVLRDATDLFRIARPDAFRRLLRLAAGQTGSLVNLSEWAAILGISSDTVASYLEILESAHVLATLRPFTGGKRSELTRAPKVYCVDCGIRNHLVHDLRALLERADAGPTLESWVFSELWKDLPSTATLHYWRSTSGAEVDFVLESGSTLIGVEVKSARLGRPTLPRSARSFVEAYQPAVFLVVNTGLSEAQGLGTTEIRWIEPWDLAASISERLT